MSRAVIVKRDSEADLPVSFDDAAQMAWSGNILRLHHLKGQAVECEPGAFGGLKRRTNASDGLINGVRQEVDIQPGSKAQLGCEFDRPGAAGLIESVERLGRDGGKHRRGTFAARATHQGLMRHHPVLMEIDDGLKRHGKG